MRLRDKVSDVKINKLKRIILGNNNDGVIYKVFVYFFIISVGFVFLYPILSMIVYSFKNAEDIINPLVNWIPTELYLENYKRAFSVLDFGETLMKTIYVTALPA